MHRNNVMFSRMLPCTYNSISLSTTTTSTSIRIVHSAQWHVCTENDAPTGRNALDAQMWSAHITPWTLPKNTKRLLLTNPIMPVIPASSSPATSAILVWCLYQIWVSCDSIQANVLAHASHHQNGVPSTVHWGLQTNQKSTIQSLRVENTPLKEYLQNSTWKQEPKFND